MRKKHFVSIEAPLRSARPAWIRTYGAGSFDSMVDLVARFCSLWAVRHDFDVERFRAEVYRD